MRVNSVTRRTLACRRQKKALLAQGYDHVPDPIWQINRGYRADERIVEVIIAEGGKSLYVKTARVTE